MPSHSLHQRICSYAMGDDTEQDGPTGREHHRIVTGQLFVEDENRENGPGMDRRLGASVAMNH
jgi:hypothetical protein